MTAETKTSGKPPRLSKPNFPAEATETQKETYGKERDEMAQIFTRLRAQTEKYIRRYPHKGSIWKADEERLEEARKKLCLKKTTRDFSGQPSSTNFDEDLKRYKSEKNVQLKGLHEHFQKYFAIIKEFAVMQQNKDASWTVHLEDIQSLDSFFQATIKKNRDRENGSEKISFEGKDFLLTASMPICSGPSSSNSEIAYIYRSTANNNLYIYFNGLLEVLDWLKALGSVHNNRLSQKIFKACKITQKREKSETHDLARQAIRATFVSFSLMLATCKRKIGLKSETVSAKPEQQPVPVQVFVNIGKLMEHLSSKACLSRIRARPSDPNLTLPTIDISTLPEPFAANDSKDSSTTFQTRKRKGTTNTSSTAQISVALTTAPKKRALEAKMEDNHSERGEKLVKHDHPLRSAMPNSSSAAEIAASAANLCENRASLGCPPLPLPYTFPPYMPYMPSPYVPYVPYTPYMNNLLGYHYGMNLLALNALTTSHASMFFNPARNIPMAANDSKESQKPEGNQPESSTSKGKN